uniref:Putative ovule protein n=1 Tax=Solanum chacoense TaxID=4108 RepID=A0A0V0HCT0_SOLCH
MLTCSFEGLLQNFNYHITGVYAPNCNVERREVWDELGAVRGLMEGPWVVCGDFNVCRFPTGKRNYQRRSTAMVEFSDFIEDLELIDLPLEGGTHTWFRGDTNNVASRIDRILFTTEWSEQFSKMKQVALQRLTSDHVPIALHCGPWDLNKSYFKFENWWMEVEGFKERVEGWWKSFEISGRPDFILARKLNC